MTSKKGGKDNDNQKLLEHILSDNTKKNEYQDSKVQWSKNMKWIKTYIEMKNVRKTEINWFESF